MVLYEIISKFETMSKFITQEGLEKLKKELEYLQTVRQKEITERLRRAIAHGDLSENFDYADAKEEQAMLQAKVAELEEKIREPKIVSRTSKSESVQIGSTVKVQSEKREFLFTILTAEEANPLEGKISVESPLGEALLGKKKGAAVEVETPNGKVTYQILQVE